MGKAFARIVRRKKVTGRLRTQGRAYRIRIRMYLGIGLIIVGGLLVAASILGYLN